MNARCDVKVRGQFVTDIMTVIEQNKVKTITLQKTTSIINYCFRSDMDTLRLNQSLMSRLMRNIQQKL